jgi:hypothetical protein
MPNHSEIFKQFVKDSKQKKEKKILKNTDSEKFNCHVEWFSNTCTKKMNTQKGWSQ